MLENGAEKGRSIILDAWAVAEKIRRQRPDFFTTLCDFAVPFRQFDEDNETYAVEPIIKCDSGGNIISVRFSNQLMQTIDPMRTGVNDFYQAYHCLCCHMTDSDNHVKFRLEGGHVLLVAAHRVLHAREAFVPSGKRHLQDAYFELDNIANKVITLNKHKGARYD
jgi:gamma-butyrobetaine dioxygenase